MMDLSISFYNF